MSIYIILGLGIVLILIFIFYNNNNNNNTEIMETCIHSPFFRKSFQLYGYDDDDISEIQLSLYNMDKKYNIDYKNNQYYFIKDNEIINEISECI
jgi:hypothetical protein